MTESRLAAARKRELKLSRGYRCDDCGVKYIPGILEIHHRRPIRAGGTDDDDNLAVLCNEGGKNCHGRWDKLVAVD